MENNKIVLSGTVGEQIALYNNKQGESFLRMSVSVARLSGAIDTLTVNMPTNLLLGKSIGEGDKLTLKGEIRTYNRYEGERRHLDIVVFAQEIAEYSGEVNDVVLQGNVGKKPVERDTPGGRHMCDMMLAVNRTCKRSDYIPCIVWGRNSQTCGNLCVGDEILIKGRLQSRIYQKVTDSGIERKTAYEVSVQQLEYIGGANGK